MSFSYCAVVGALPSLTLLLLAGPLRHIVPATLLPGSSEVEPCPVCRTEVDDRWLAAARYALGAAGGLLTALLLILLSGRGNGGGQALGGRAQVRFAARVPGEPRPGGVLRRPRVAP